MLKTVELLKRFDVDTTSFDDLIALSAFAKVLHAEYEALKTPVPEWLTDAMKSLTRAIAAKQKDAIEKRLKEVRATKATLKTAAERRADLEAEEKELVALIG